MSSDLYTAVVKKLFFIIEQVIQTIFPSLNISNNPPCPKDATGIVCFIFIDVFFLVSSKIISVDFFSVINSLVESSQVMPHGKLSSTVYFCKVYA